MTTALITKGMVCKGEKVIIQQFILPFNFQLKRDIFKLNLKNQDTKKLNLSIDENKVNLNKLSQLKLNVKLSDKFKLNLKKCED